MNAFDFVVTVALGLILASVAFNQNIPLINGVTSIFLFNGFHFPLRWSALTKKQLKP